MHTTQIRVVVLSHTEEKRLESMLKKGRWTPRELIRARILLTAHTNNHQSNGEIGQHVECHQETVRQVRNKYLDEGLEAALFDRPRSGQPKKLTDKQEAYVIATACTNVPAGAGHWTLKLLTKNLWQSRRKKVSRETIRRILLANDLKPWQKKNVVYSENHR